MPKNSSLHIANKAKQDEFYTQWSDIKKEVQAYIEYNPDVFRGKTILCPCDDPEWSNFTKFFALHFVEYGLKKFISTSYAVESKVNMEYYQASFFEEQSPIFDEKKTRAKGKIFILDSEDVNHDGKIDIEDLQWNYMDGDGDFRSKEVEEFRNEADVIITNPPFSLFREFLNWIIEDNKRFLIISNMNAITYKEVFPLIKNNRMWMGLGFGRSFQGFIVPESYPLNGTEARIDKDGNRIVSTNNTIWLTNIEHGRRHQPLHLMTMADNLKHSKHKKVKEKLAYDKYDNYDAIEIPFTDAIPSDYQGVMGVPISFLYKYCPEQFEIIKFRKGDDGKDLSINGKCPYFRILIKNKKCNWFCEGRKDEQTNRTA
ncbi:putative adenine-specific methylase [Clostridia bacterium]|nr:putative adenine-specific methylase [Clostridia bacterium]